MLLSTPLNYSKLIQFRGDIYLNANTVPVLCNRNINLTFSKLNTKRVCIIT